MTNHTTGALPSSLPALFAQLGGDIRLISCILRNGPNGWHAIDTNNHFPVGVVSVSQDACGVFVNYDAFTKNLGFSTTVDEFFATHERLTAGASVGYGQAYIQFGKAGQTGPCDPATISSNGNVQFLLICA